MSVRALPNPKFDAAALERCKIRHCRSDADPAAHITEEGGRFFFHIDPLNNNCSITSCHSIAIDITAVVPLEKLDDTGEAASWGIITQHVATFVNSSTTSSDVLSFDIPAGSLSCASQYPQWGDSAYIDCYAVTSGNTAIFLKQDRHTQRSGP